MENQMEEKSEQKSRGPGKGGFGFVFFLSLLAAVLALARLRRAFASVRVLALTCAVSFAAVCLFSAAALPHMNFEEYEAPMASACAPSESSEPSPLL